MTSSTFRLLFRLGCNGTVGGDEVSNFYHIHKYISDITLPRTRRQYVVLCGSWQYCYSQLYSETYPCLRLRLAWLALYYTLQAYTIGESSGGALAFIPLLFWCLLIWFHNKNLDTHHHGNAIILILNISEISEIQKPLFTSILHFFLEVFISDFSIIDWLQLRRNSESSF